MKTLLLKLTILFVFGTGLSGCMGTGGLIIDTEPIVIGDPPRHEEHRNRHIRQGRKKHLKIPPGHMPPPGECRVWYYDRPPGHQPPPVACHRIRHRIPYGAVVIRG